MVKVREIDSLRYYVENNKLNDRVLYPKAGNIFYRIFNYIFKRYGTLHIVKLDSLWIFSLHYKGKCIMSICSSSNFDCINIAYRYLYIEGDSIRHSNTAYEQEFRVARGKRKDEMYRIFLKMLYNL